MNYKHFTKQERDEIFILLNKGYSMRDIGYALKRNPSSVSREIKRNKVKGEYLPDKAQHKARVRRRAAKFQWLKIRHTPGLEEFIQDKLKQNWSPEQIVGRLRLENNDKQSIVSFKTIYKYLYTHYGQEYCQYLKYKHHKKKKRTRIKQPREHIKNRVFIENRPEIINNRLRIL